MKKNFLLFLILLFLAGSFSRGFAVKIDFLQNSGDQLQPPAGVPKNTATNQPSVQSGPENFGAAANTPQEQKTPDNNLQPQQNKPLVDTKGVPWISLTVILVIVFIVVVFIVAALI